MWLLHSVAGGGAGRESSSMWKSDSAFACAGAGSFTLGWGCSARPPLRAVAASPLALPVPGAPFGRLPPLFLPLPGAGVDQDCTTALLRSSPASAAAEEPGTAGTGADVGCELC